MKILRDYRVAGFLRVNDTGIEAQVSDQVTLFLDRDAEPGFPESIVATIQHPIVRVSCGSMTSYVFEYDENDLNGAAALLRPQDIIDATVVSGVTVVANNLDSEIARATAAEGVLQDNIDAEETRALAAEALLAPKDSPTFTGTVVLPSTTSIGVVSSTEIGHLDGVTSALQTQLNAKAPAASPTLSGTVTLSGGFTQSGTDTSILNAPLRFKGYTVAGLAALTPAAGDRAFVTDADATTFASIVAGGGANVVPVFYNGTNWIIA